MSLIILFGLTHNTHVEKQYEIVWILMFAWAMLFDVVVMCKL